MKLLSHKVKIQSKFASPLSRTYLLQKKKKKNWDSLDRWIKMAVVKEFM